MTYLLLVVAFWLGMLIERHFVHHTQTMYTQGSLDEITSPYGPAPKRYYQTGGVDGDIDLFTRWPVQPEWGQAGGAQSLKTYSLQA